MVFAAVADPSSLLFSFSLSLSPLSPLSFSSPEFASFAIRPTLKSNWSAIATHDTTDLRTYTTRREMNAGFRLSVTLPICVFTPYAS